MHAALLVASAGCQQVFGLDPPRVEADASTGIDAIDAAPVCLGETPFRVCIASSVPLQLSVPGDTSIDTSTPCTAVDPAHTDWCIVAAHTITIDARYRATGTRPLVIVALETLSIGPKGEVVVGSTRVAAGPAANSSLCATVGPGASSTNGGGGGAGGSFGTQGGSGGAGDSGNVTGATAAGVPSSNAVPTTLRGGCAGSAGGTGTGPAAAVGAGGGAVYLVAGTTMTIDGNVNAGGAGGTGGLPSKGGGSGGGSGGLIVLWSPTIALAGELQANGGGGGGGSDNGAGGSVGSDATSATMAASGGLGGGASGCSLAPGCGGAGSLGASGGQSGANDSTGAGAGGGGGGAGVITVLSRQTLSGNISPPPT